MSDSHIEIFQLKDGETGISVKFDSETVWLSQKQMSNLFDKDSDTIGLHLRNIYKSGELEELSTTEKSSVVQKEGNRNVRRTIKLYNLDAIISVGYRVNSKRGIQFRIWASKILKQYLLKGYALDNERLSQQNAQLKELQESVKILGEVVNHRELSSDESVGLLKIISDYSYALDILDQYDYQQLDIVETSGKESFRLSYEEGIKQINLAKKSSWK